MEVILALILIMSTMIFSIVFLKKTIRNIVIFDKNCNLIEIERTIIKKSTIRFLGTSLVLLAIFIIATLKFTDFIENGEMKVIITYFVILIVGVLSDIYFLKEVKIEKLPKVKEELKICKTVLLVNCSIFIVLFFLKVLNG